jgi:predicted nucleotidyltransferase
VRLFGSLARGDAGERFDIDLAVEVIDRRRFFAACADADRLVTRKLDVIDLPDASPLLRSRVEDDGIDLP